MRIDSCSCSFFGLAVLGIAAAGADVAAAADVDDVAF